MEKKEARGGKRKGAGRPKKEETVVMRVPESLEIFIKNLIKKMKTILITILSVICLTSCTDITDQEHSYIDPHLKIFVKRFYAEAAKRHKELRQDMTMVLTDDLNTNYTGVFGLTLYDLREIKIDSNFTLNALSQKDAIDSLTIEFIVFHEMGHLILGRGHEPYPTYSIMTVDEQWLYDYQTDPDKRKILIDELFSKK